MELTKFGCCAKAQWQQTCRQWIQGPGMPCFFSPQQPLGFLQGIVAGQTFGFIQQKNTMNRTSFNRIRPDSWLLAQFNLFYLLASKQLSLL
jgi:hypothetical protein